MAKSAQRGVNIFAIWMLVFLGLWLASTIWLVVLYNHQEDLKSRTNQLIAAKSRAISDPEERSIELVKQAQAGGPTIAGLLEEARSESAHLATGEPSDQPAAIRQKRNAMIDRMDSETVVAEAKSYRDLSLLDSLSRLYDAYKNSDGIRREAEERAKRMQDEVDTLRARADKQKQDFDKQAEELTAKVTEMEKARDAFRKERDEAVARLEREFESRRGEYETEIADSRKAIASAGQKNEELRKRVDDLLVKYGDLQIAPGTLTTARLPDGEVLTAVAGDPVVYINRGKNHGVVLGLPFTVYSQNTGIPADGRGKARIEVVSVSDRSAECRVQFVRPNEVILSGDLIANPIYDPDRPLTFLVLGRFDLNRDGIEDPDGAADVEKLVKSWGGKPVTELTALTDFVVVGAAPFKPRAAADVAAAEAETNERLRREHQRYADILDAANNMHVPVLTQDVFLNFLGLSTRVTAR